MGKVERQLMDFTHYTNPIITRIHIAPTGI
jgi:hypothetical protein